MQEIISNVYNACKMQIIRLKLTISSIFPMRTARVHKPKAHLNMQFLGVAENILQKYLWNY